MLEETQSPSLLNLTTEIVAAYVAKNAVPPADLPTLIHSVHSALTTTTAGPAPEAEPERKAPAVPVKKSIHDDFLICLDDGKRFKSLKRHIMTSYGMTPQNYREKWGLPKDYPMVAPGYAASRSALAKSLGLGRKAMVTPAPQGAGAPKMSEPKPAKAARRPAKAMA